MTNQEQNREALIEHIAEQDRIIRRRNQQIANQAQNARESQRAIEEQDARNNSLAADLAAAIVRAEKAERERDSWRAQVPLADWEKELIQHAESRPHGPEVTGAMAARAMLVLAKHGYRPGHTITHEALTAALTTPPRPEGAEKVEKVLRHYWAGDVDGDDLADRIAEEMNR